jgi:ABC-type lipoprotein export system ATPase subunit/ABC-type lipoprotein release transport system permease subunit
LLKEIENGYITSKGSRILLLKLNQVSKTYTYGNQILNVVDHVSFEVARGTFVAIVGPSGCGKSTLLNMIGALDQPTHGQIYFDQQEINTFSEKEKEKYRLQTIGTIFQSFNLIPQLTAIENIEIPMIIAGIPRSVRKLKCEELLELVGLTDRKDHKPNQLSGGQKQRVAIARALALDPPILLADEPTGALDSHNSDLILQQLKAINEKKGTTIIMVTHSAEMASHADHLIQMKDGHVIEEQINSPRIAREPIYPRKLKQMSFFASLKNAMSNLVKKKWRSILVCIGSSIGICGIALVIGLGMGIERQIIKEITPLLDPLKLEVTQKENEMVPVTDEQLQKIAQIEGVQSAFHTYEVQGELLYQNKVTNRVFVQSAKPLESLSESDKDKLFYGEYPLVDNEIILPMSLADYLVTPGTDVKSLVGQSVTWQMIDYASQSGSERITLDMKISGILIPGVLGSLGNPLIEYRFSQKLNKLSESMTLTVIKSSQVVVDEQNQISQVQQSIEKMNLFVIPPDILIKSITKYSRIAQSVLSFFAGISLVVSSIMIGIVLYTSVLERTKEIGILKALGARRKDILRTFITEAGCIGFFAGAIGLLTASSLGFIGNVIFKQTMFENQEGFNIFIFPISLILGCVALSTCLSICAGWIPARRASKLNPIDALKYE